MDRFCRALPFLAPAYCLRSLRRLERRKRLPMTSPKKPRDTLPPGDTEADALAALFTVRYPMAPDVPPRGFSRTAPRSSCSTRRHARLSPRGHRRPRKPWGGRRHWQAHCHPSPPMPPPRPMSPSSPPEAPMACGVGGLLRCLRAGAQATLGTTRTKRLHRSPAGPRAPIRRLTTEEVIELLKAQAPPPSRGSDMASEVPEDEPADEGDGDEETDDDCGDEEVGEEYEGNIEWDITNRIIEDALNLGYSVSVFGEEGWPLALGRLERSTNTREINAALGETEQEFLRFTDDDGTIVGWVLLAWGAGRDMIGDYSENDATVAVLRMAWALSEATD